MSPVVGALAVANSVLGSQPSLPRKDRDLIAHANCTQLAADESIYTPNGDSVEPDITALRLTRARLKKLHCPVAE